MVNLDKLVEAAYPGFPSDRNVKATKDSALWYHIGNDPACLRVPIVEVLRRNPIELDRFAEAVRNFATANLDDLYFDWENLETYDYSGDECYQALLDLREKLHHKEVAVDIETRRVEFEDNKFLAIGFAFDDNVCYSFHDIPIIGSNSGDHKPEVWQALNDILTDENICFVWHNGKFDCTRLKYMCNLDARVDEDTMLMHYACINEKRGTHGLKDLGQIYLQAPPWDDELDRIKREWCKKNKVKLGDFMYDDIPTSVLIPYMQRDCIATIRLLKRFRSLAREGSNFVYRMLVKASNVYGQMELNGVKIDLEYLEDLDWDLELRIMEAKSKINSVVDRIWDAKQYVLETGAKSVPKEFNVKSSKQLKWLISKALGYNVDSTDAATLTAISKEVEEGSLAAVLIGAISDLRKANKYMDTYVQGIRNSLCGDLRIRATYNLHGTETGRLSCSNPNLQNIPRDKKIKNIFCADEGYKLVQLDYSQAELRVLALLSGDEFMIKAYQDGKDFHDAVATDMFGPDFDKEQRVMAKTINFGIAYGRGPGSIAETFNKSMTEAVQIINKWFQPMPKVKEYIQNRRKMPLRGDECITPLGRKRHFVITNDNLNHIQNEYINTPIQSLASDFTMLSLIDIYDWIEEHNIDAKIVVTVHDSIILEVKDDEELIKQVAQACKEIMAGVPSKYIKNCEVPFKADAEQGYNWGSLEEL